MFLNFVDRRAELDQLNHAHSQNGFHFVVIYGRRRVGKTELIKQFIKGKDSVYFLCDKSGTAYNIGRFKKKIAEYLGEPVIETSDLEEIFSYFSRKARPKTVLIFDEFTYLIEKDDSIPSMFQVIIDEVLSKTEMTLIISGSSMSMMIAGVLSHNSPLYGRKTGHIELSPIQLTDVNGFFPASTIEDNIKVYSLLGGVPYYLIKFTDGQDILTNIREHILNKQGGLYEETDFLLTEELREPDVYKTIISAVASGATRVTEIADKCKIKPTDLDKYLKILIRLGIIKKECPITENKSKKTIYTVDDNFFAFWFRFCEPRKSDLEIRDTAVVENTLKKELNMFVGRGFEKIIREEMLRKLCTGMFEDIGRWWGYYRDGDRRRELEIDVVGLNKEKNLAGFFECKWMGLSEGEAKNILAGLKRKAAYVEWHNRGRDEAYGLFAKKVAGKERLREDGFLVFDLDDFAGLGT